MIVVAIIGILAAVAIPQYQNYITKSQVSRVMSETGSLRTAVESCMLEGKDTSECTVGATASNLLGDDTEPPADETNNEEGFPVVTIDLENNTASIVATFGQNAAAVIKGGKLGWTRDSNGTWTCGTNEKVAAKFVPAGCDGELEVEG